MPGAMVQRRIQFSTSKCLSERVTPFPLPLPSSASPSPPVGHVFVAQLPLAQSSSSSYSIHTQTAAMIINGAESVSDSVLLCSCWCTAASFKPDSSAGLRSRQSLTYCWQWTVGRSVAEAVCGTVVVLLVAVVCSCTACTGL